MLQLTIKVAKDVLYDTLVKLLDDKYEIDEIMVRRKELFKYFKEKRTKAVSTSHHGSTMRD